MSIILNEREFAENALRDHILGAKPVETLSRVARYYYAEGYKKTEIGHKLEDFMLQCDPAVNIVKWQSTIDWVAKGADKLELIELDYIPVTQKELDVCGLLSGLQLPRLMFTLICLAKYGDAINEKNNGWVNREDKDVFRLANITTPVVRQSLMMNDLMTMGLIKFSKKVDNINTNVLCLDHKGEPALKISDFRNLGNQYMKYMGGPYFECTSCGLVIRRTNNNHLYCPDCAAEANRLKTRSWQKGLSL